MPPQNTRRYFEELNRQIKGRAPGSPEFEALIRSKIGGQFQGLTGPGTMAKAELIGKPEDRIYGEYAGVNFGPSSTLEGIKKELLGRGGAWTSSLPNQVSNLPEGKTIFGMGRQANPNVWAHEFRHELVNDDRYFDGEITNRLFDVLYGSTSLPAYKSNVEQAYRFILRNSDDYRKLPFEEREALNSVSLKDQEDFVLARLKGLLSEENLQRENVSTSSRMLNALKNTFSKNLLERTRELNQSIRRTEDLPKEAIELRSRLPFLNFVGKLEKYENPAKRASGSPLTGETAPSKEQLRKLMLAMNPDAEQIEEAAAAAPRVPAAVKALGRGFYEANIAPLLSPYETAMAIFGAGKEMVRAPVETTKSMARSELERLQQAERSPEAAAEYAGGMFSPFSMLRRAPTMREITAYQGSPAKFEPTPNNPLGEFDVTKAGSGVGQQNRGPGTYIAENPKVAERYRMKYSPVMNIGEQRSPGYMYTVDLPDPMIEKMLDLDAPIVNQSKFIRDKIMQVSNDPALPPDSAELLRQLLTSKDRTVQKYPLTGLGLVSVPREFGGIFKDVTEANTILQRYGIPGSKWKDDISRGPDKGTRNFVVFPGEEKKVKILEREGPKGERAFSVDPQTRSPDFKRWFGGSEVVDKQGNPLVVYHGTYAQFNEFEPGRAGAIYFTPDVKYASDYGENLMPSYLKVNKLADLTDPNSDAYKLAVKTFNESGGWSSNEDSWANLLDEGRTNPSFDPKTDMTWEIFDLPEAGVDAALLEAGYDGVKLQERPGIDSYAVFDPKQIRPAADPLAKRR